MRLAYQTNTWGGVVGHPVGVTSIKDLYYLANGSTEDALRDIATAGYEGAELFDGNLMQYADSAADFTALLDNGGLSLVGVYSGANFIFADVLPEELWRIENAARLGSELGAEFLVVGGGAQRTTAATCKERVPTRIESDTGKMKIERFVPAGVVVAGVRQITERDPRHESAARGFEIELAPGYSAIGERLRVVRAGDAGCTRNCRSWSSRNSRCTRRCSRGRRRGCGRCRSR